MVVNPGVCSAGQGLGRKKHEVREICQENVDQLRVGVAIPAHLILLLEIVENCGRTLRYYRKHCVLLLGIEFIHQLKPTVNHFLKLFETFVGDPFENIRRIIHKESCAVGFDKLSYCITHITRFDPLPII